MNERIAVLENNVKQHDMRLNKHGEQIDALKQENAKQETVLNKLCVNLDKNSEITNKNHEMIAEIRTQSKTIMWLVASLVTGIPAVVSLYFALKQIGVFS